MSTTPFFTTDGPAADVGHHPGEIDLSFPSIMAWGMTGFSVVFGATGSWLLASLACLVAGLLAGLLNGCIVVKLGMPSLVATIGT